MVKEFGVRKHPSGDLLNTGLSDHFVPFMTIFPIFQKTSLVC